MRTLIVVLPLVLAAATYGCTDRGNQSTAQTIKALKNQTQELSTQLNEQRQATQQAQVDAEDAANEAQDAQDEADDAQDDADDAQDGLQPGTRARLVARIERSRIDADTRCLANAECNCKKEGGTWVQGKITVVHGPHGELSASGASECKWR